MRPRLFALATAVAMPLIAIDAVASCTAGNPNASVIESTPTSAFVNNGDGTVTHNLTGLMWKRCAQGLSGAGCATGTAIKMTWKEALAAAVADPTAGYSDWRVPNRKELESIVERCGFNPAINQTIFPGRPAHWFWSGSTRAVDPGSAWAIHFSPGTAGTLVKTTPDYVYVHLVRGGRFLSPFDVQSDFVPMPFSFAPQTGVARSTLTTSNTITVVGINAISPVSIAGGGYAVNNGAYTTTGGTVKNGDHITLQQNSSANYGTTTTATLTIGGVSGAFSVTTAPAPGLTVIKGGSGNGTVTSDPPGIDCGIDCNEPFAIPSSVTLTAAAAPGSVFMGWLGACIGTGPCNVLFSGPTEVSATFAPDVVTPRIDIDANGSYDALTDGLMTIRYLFGLSGSALVNNAVGLGATRTSPAEIWQYLDNIEPPLDVDGNGQADALTDGLIVIRYLFGLRGAALIAGALGPGATRTSAQQIETYIQSLMP